MYDEDNRLITSSKFQDDIEVENTLRPQTIDEYIGQEKVKSNLKVYMYAANQRKEPLDHVLLYGPPGLGKTTLAHIISNEMNAQIKVTSGPAIEKAGDLASILTNINEGDIVFIDEIHRINKSVEEILYPAMEDFALDFIIGKGPSARSVRLSLPKFTLIGATTRAGNLSSPLRDRFGVMFRLDMYKDQELEKIVKRSAKILNINIDDDAALEIAKRSRGTPRISNRLLKRVRDYATYEKKKVVDVDITKKSLKLMDIDELGLDITDRQLLISMIEKFSGGPVGLDTLSASTGEEVITISDVYEPYLIQLGFIARTPRGRVCLKRAYEHLGYDVPQEVSSQLSFFDKKDDNEKE